MLLVLHFRHHSQRLRLTEVLLSRCQGQAAGLGGSAEIILLSLWSNPSGNHQHCRNDREKPSAPTSLAMRAPISELDQPGERGHLCGPPGTWSHSCWRHLVGEFLVLWLCTCCLCMACDAESLSLPPEKPWQRAFIWRKLISGQPSPGKMSVRQ